jgi:aspartate dehydrogenase
MREGKLTIGLIGCGAIGSILAREIDRGTVGDIKLIAVYDQIQERAEKLVECLRSKPKVTRSLDELLSIPDTELVLEAGSQTALKECAVKVLQAGKNLMAMSAGAFVDTQFLNEVQRTLTATGRTMWLPSGAIAGLDGLKAATMARVDSVTLTTTKPPASLVGAPGTKGMDLSRLETATEVFKGPADEACRLFPQNVNVAASLSLSGIGPKRTMVRIVADPNVDKNIHEIEVKGSFGVLRARVENVPSPENPKTSYLAILSALATLRKLTKQMQVGT